MELQAELTQKDQQFLEQSLNGPMWKVILQIGTPLALYQLLSQAFTILDTMMAAHISEESVSAVAYLAQLNAILSAVGGGLAVGAGIQISRAYGEGDLALVRRRISSLYAICLGVGVALLALILPFTSTFLRLAGTPELLIEAGSQYFVVELFVMVVTFINNVYIAVERARGNAGRIFRLNLLVIGTKLSLTALFVYGMDGTLVMIAAASLASQLLLFGFALKNSICGRSAFSFSAQAVTARREVVGPMVQNSVPVIAERAFFAFGKTIVNAMCGVYGPLMVGAMGVSNNMGGITTNEQMQVLDESGNATFPGTINAVLFHSTTGVYSDGYVSAKGQNTSSDLRLKDVLGSVTLPLERIAKAPIFRFSWKDGSGGESAGSSAQYWRSALPAAVRERDGYLEMQYGNIALISAVAIARETLRLASRVSDHERRIRELEAENRRLRETLAA